MTVGLSHIVRGIPDRIQRGGGSVLVESTGRVTLRPPSGDPLMRIRNPADTTTTFFVATDSGNTTIGGTLTVSGTGTHQFSGPVEARGQSADPRVDINALDEGRNAVLNYRVNGSVRHQVLMLSSNKDLVIRSSTDGVGTTEALRVVNANAYVSVAARLGVGTASPAAPLDVDGDAYFRTGRTVYVNTIRPYSLSGGFGLTVALNNTANTPMRVMQEAANATAPVLVVRVGATPGSGGDALQVQDSGGGVQFRITGAGVPQLNFDFPLQSFDSGGTARTLIALSTSNIVVVGNVGNRLNLRTNEGVYTATADGPINGHLTLTINGTTYKLATVA